jgi:hypothetical protein
MLVRNGTRGWISMMGPPNNGSLESPREEFGFDSGQ